MEQGDPAKSAEYPDFEDSKVQPRSTRNEDRISRPANPTPTFVIDIQQLNALRQKADPNRVTTI